MGAETGGLELLLRSSLGARYEELRRKENDVYFHHILSIKYNIRSIIVYFKIIIKKKMLK